MALGTQAGMGTSSSVTGASLSEPEIGILRMAQGSATHRETEAQAQLEHRSSCGDWVSLLGTHLLEVVKGSQDDVVATSDQADSGQQLQHQSLGSAGPHGVRGLEPWGRRGDGGTRDNRGQGISYLALLLLRLRVISLTQAGWFITRLKPDLGRGKEH